MSSGAPTITQLAWVPCTCTRTILRTTNNSPTIVHAHRIKIHLFRPISGVACGNGCVDPPTRIIAETSKETSMRTDRLSHCGRRMSIFLLMLVLRGVCSQPANPVSTGVCYEQDRNYLAGTHAASRSVFPGVPSRWFPLFQRTGRPRPGHRQGGRRGHCGRDGARPPEPLGGSQGGRQE